jgi:hypothetical protein
MGNDPLREPGECGHPAVGSRDNTETETAADAYATRHDPFVYFHSIIDNTTLCDSHVVNLNLLPQDLAALGATPNYVFITPDLCSDGHDASCADTSRPGGFPGIEQFLQQWVPAITGSPAFKEQNGLLIITFDEASTSDTSSCCGEIPGPGSPLPGLTGAGGGEVGAVLLSPCIKPGTISMVAYNHYTMLRSVEDIFGLPHLGYAQLPGEQSFGSDVFTNAAACSAPPSVALRATVPGHGGAGAARTVTLSFSSKAARSTFTLQERVAAHGHVRAGAWRYVVKASASGSARFRGAAGTKYQFRARATSPLGLTGPWVTRTLTVGGHHS